MKKIGFIDYYIDEWHANNYPAMIRKSSYGDRFEVALAWEEIKKEGRKSLDDWCKEQNVDKASSIEEVVRECDYIVVLSPDNAERHEDLADLPLRSGKPVYIDKPIAPSLAAAKRLFTKASKYDTPMMSSSALRFVPDLEKALEEQIKAKRVDFVSTIGEGQFDIYAIHQLEMLVMLLGTGAKRVKQCGTDIVTHMLVDYEDGRRGTVTMMPGQPLQLNACYGEESGFTLTSMGDFFAGFIEAMLSFFESGESRIPVEQTLEIAALLETGSLAIKQPDKWFTVINN